MSVFIKFSVQGNSRVITCRRGTVFSYTAIKTFSHSKLKEVTAFKLERPTTKKLIAERFTKKLISSKKKIILPMLRNMPCYAVKKLRTKTLAKFRILTEVDGEE